MPLVLWRPRGLCLPKICKPALQRLKTGALPWCWAPRHKAILRIIFPAPIRSGCDDLQQMLDDPNLKAILCARGGYGMSRIIDHLNFKTFVEHPKWIIGFSDITVLHSHLFSNYKIASLHAPMAAAFNNGGFSNPYIQSLKAALEGTPIDYECAPHELNRVGKASGRLVGGNLSLLAHLVGTDSDINTKGRILFLEDLGEYLYNIDRMMLQLARTGKLKNCRV